MQKLIKLIYKAFIVLLSKNLKTKQFSSLNPLNHFMITSVVNAK